MTVYVAVFMAVAVFVAAPVLVAALESGNDAVVVIHARRRARVRTGT